MQFENYFDFLRMYINRYLSPLRVPLIMLAALIAVACNTDTKQSEDPGYIRGSELTVTRFYLQANSKIMSNLDSVYFAIDLERGVIFNADSLPMGTPINKLIPVISVPQTVESVQVVMEDEDGERKVVDYREHPSDTIDFTKRVTLELSAVNGSAVRSYRLLVNVHKMNPDSLNFDLEARMAIPSRSNAPKAQKSVTRDSVVYTLIEEADGSHTIASTGNIASGKWNKQAIQFGFSPDLSSFTATTDAFFILSAEGNLYRSADAITWTHTEAPKWESIIGAFGSKLQGVREAEGKLVHTQYPSDGFQESAINSNFPYSESTDMKIYSTKWSSQPLGLIVGGTTQAGMTGATWAFDGTVWCQISENSLPAIKGGTLVPYFAYLKSSTMWIFNEYSIWMYIGGICADGSLNQNIYLTYDNGVHWQKAPEAMQLPESINAMYRIGHAVASTPLEANFAPEAWFAVEKGGKGQRRLPYVINGYNISWNCPYIYLIGGYSDAAATQLNPWIYRGVINRMSFKPLI